MVKIIKNILLDTLKENDRWSRTSLTLIVSFIFTLLVGLFIVLSDSVLNVEINRYAIDVFDTMVIFVATMTGFNITDKKFINRNKRDNTEEEQDGTI